MIYLKVFQQTWKIDFIQILFPLESPGLASLVLFVYLRHARQPTFHQVEGIALRQQHQEAVHGGQQLLVAVQQLK